MIELDELYRAVWEHPDDDALRLVLADALQVAGDPRGDFIHAQFDARPDESLARRLLQRHGMSWLGGLRGHVIPLAYEKGFLASCQLRGSGSTGCPEWSTVHTIELACDDADFLRDPVMRSLRHLSGESRQLVEQVLGSRAVARILETLEGRPWSLVARHHAQLEQLPRLRRFSVTETPNLENCPLAVERGPDNRLSILRATYDPALLLILNGLPADTFIEVHAHGVPRAHLAALHGALGRCTRLAIREVVPAPDEPDLREPEEEIGD